MELTNMNEISSLFETLKLIAGLFTGVSGISIPS
jgi:hypothetical protein